jgi:WhiB family redox-sensing transcriptional regulator
MTNEPLMTDKHATFDPGDNPQRPALTAASTPRRAPRGTMYADQEPPEPITDNWNWQLFAACRGMDVEIFYHPWGERNRSRKDRINRAKNICQHCPVISECARHALEAREPYGVWGGLSEDDRADILGRPRRRRSSGDVDSLTERSPRPLARGR